MPVASDVLETGENFGNNCAIKLRVMGYIKSWFRMYYSVCAISRDVCFQSGPVNDVSDMNLCRLYDVL